MAWLDKKEKDELQTQAETWKQKAEASAKEQEALAAKLKTLEEERTTERETVQKMQSEFERIKTELAAKETNKTTTQVQEEVADFDTDPERAFLQRTKPLADITVRNAAQTARLLAQQQLDNQDMQSGGNTFDGRLFRAWATDIDREVSKYPPASMITPEAWLGVFYYFKGIRSDELSNPETRKKKYPFLESGRTSVQHTMEPKTKPEDVLTDQEKHIANRMGVSEEKFLLRKKQLKFTGA